MLEIWVLSLASVFIVSLISLIGVATLSMNHEKLNKYLHLLVSFSAGALMGDAFIHLLPEVAEEYGFGLEISGMVLFAIVFSLVLEKIIRWRHCHVPTSRDHPHPVATINLVGEAVHNFLDGAIIGASYLISIPVGLATTLAVVFHEIPQEIGDFGVLVHSGLSRKKALMYNFGVALTAFLGAVIALAAASFVENIEFFAAPFAAGLFIYIAGTDLIPELHKNDDTATSIMEMTAFLLGVGVMFALLLVLE